MVDKYEAIKNCVVDQKKYWIGNKCQSFDDLKDTYTPLINQGTCSKDDGIVYKNGKCDVKNQKMKEVMDCYSKPNHVYYRRDCISKNELNELKLNTVCEKNMYTRNNDRNTKCIPVEENILDTICYSDGVKIKDKACYEDLRKVHKVVCRKDTTYDNLKKKCVEKSFHPPGIEQIVFMGMAYGASKVYSIVKKKLDKGGE